MDEEAKKEPNYPIIVGDAKSMVVVVSRTQAYRLNNPGITALLVEQNWADSSAGVVTLKLMALPRGEDKAIATLTAKRLADLPAVEACLVRELAEKLEQVGGYYERFTNG